MTHTIPVSGVVTQRFGCTGFPAEPAYGTCAHFHPAWDIAALRGTPIKASAAGKVVAAGWNGIIAAGYPHAGEQAGWGGGNVVVIQHNADPFYSLYGHCLDIQTAVGHSVAQGQQIARVDSTGNSTGDHVHWGLWYKDLWFNYGTPIDPKRVLAGGDLAGNSHYNPPSPVLHVRVSIGANIRNDPSTKNASLGTVTSTWVGTLSLVFGGWVTGGGYTVNGVYGNTWAKIWLNGGWRYVAKPFVRFV